MCSINYGRAALVVLNSLLDSCSFKKYCNWKIFIDFYNILEPFLKNNGAQTLCMFWVPHFYFTPKFVILFREVMWVKYFSRFMTDYQWKNIQWYFFPKSSVMHLKEVGKCSVKEEDQRAFKIT